MLQIDKGVPPPRATGSGVKKYPFAEMGVGDSLFVADRSQVQVTSAANQWKIRHAPDAKFTTKTESGGCRIWRIG